MLWKTGSELNTVIFVFQPLNQLVKANLSTLMSCGSIFLNMKLSSYFQILFISFCFYLFRSYKSGSGINNRRTELFLKEHEHLRK